MWNKINKIDEKGERTCVAYYGGEYSAEYALYLYWCQVLMHCDYMNLRNRRNFNETRVISKTMRSAMVEIGTDAYICSALKEHDYNATVGTSYSKHDFEPNYPTK